MYDCTVAKSAIYFVIETMEVCVYISQTYIIHKYKMKAFKVAPYSFLKPGKFMIWIKMFSGLLLVRKQELCNLYKTIFLELQMINKHDVIVVAMATMTFQYGRHFGVKRILLEKTSGYPHFLFHEKFCISIMEYLNEFKKILYSHFL